MSILIIRAELSRISQACGWAGLGRFGAGVGEPKWKPRAWVGDVMVKLFIKLVLRRVFGVLELGSIVKCRGDFRALGREMGRGLGLSVAMVWSAGILWFVVI
jgi:hypothetical protein